MNTKNLHPELGSGALREALPTINKALEIYLSHALDAVCRAEEQQKRMPFDHDNNNSLEGYKKWRDAAYQAMNALAAPSRQGAGGAETPIGFWEWLEANREEVKRWPGWMKGEAGS